MVVQDYGFKGIALYDDIRRQLGEHPAHAWVSYLGEEYPLSRYEARSVLRGLTLYPHLTPDEVVLQVLQWRAWKRGLDQPPTQAP